MMRRDPQDESGGGSDDLFQPRSPSLPVAVRPRGSSGGEEGTRHGASLGRRLRPAPSSLRVRARGNLPRRSGRAQRQRVQRLSRSAGSLPMTGSNDGDSSSPSLSLRGDGSSLYSLGLPMSSSSSLPSLEARVGAITSSSSSSVSLWDSSISLSTSEGSASMGRGSSVGSESSRSFGTTGDGESGESGDSASDSGEHKAQGAGAEVEGGGEAPSVGSQATSHRMGSTCSFDPSSIGGHLPSVSSRSSRRHRHRARRHGRKHVGSNSARQPNSQYLHAYGGGGTRQQQQQHKRQRKKRRSKKGSQRRTSPSVPGYGDVRKYPSPVHFGGSPRRAHHHHHHHHHHHQTVSETSDSPTGEREGAGVDDDTHHHVRRLRKRLRRQMARLDCPMETPNPNWTFPFYLDCAIYWYGKGNVCLRSIAGETNPYFDPERATVIYVHGWSKNSTLRGFRESMNWKMDDPEHGVDADKAAAWIDAGYNVGVFYWNQLADDKIHLAEAKVWTCRSRVGMRWRQLEVSTRGRSENGPDRAVHFVKAPDGTPCASDTFVEHYLALFEAQEHSSSAEDSGDESCSRSGLRPRRRRQWTEASRTVRLIGHDLGAQLIVNATHTLYDRLAKGTVREGSILPSRMCLVDPFFTSGRKSYLGGQTVSAHVCDQVDALTVRGVAIELVACSTKSNDWGGSRSNQLRHKVAYVRLLPWPADISRRSLGRSHKAGPNIYMLSFGGFSADGTPLSLHHASQPRPRPESPKTRMHSYERTLDDDDNNADNHPNEPGPSPSSPHLPPPRTPHPQQAPLDEVVARKRKLGLLKRKTVERVGRWRYLSQRTDQEIRVMQASHYSWKQISPFQWLRNER